MRSRTVLVAGLVVASGLGLGTALGSVEEARSLEREGEPLQARQLLERLVQADAPDPQALLEWASFLERYGDSGAVAAYAVALEAMEGGAAAELDGVRRRLVVAAIMHGDLAAARTAFEGLSESGWTSADAVLQPQSPPAPESVHIPGTLNSFSRMAALSTDLQTDGILPSLARTIFTGGYHAARGTGILEPTEYLKLLRQYLTQARELEAFAGDDHTVDVAECESAETARLLKIIGYRLRGECGPDAVLETVNPSRAFLAIDSAFPLADLELAFRDQEPFSTALGPTRIPVLFGSEYWLSAAQSKEDTFIDKFIDDPTLARLYAAMANAHRPVAEALRETVDAERLRDYAPVLDFYGEMFEIRDGVAVVPGGARARPAWEKLTDANINNPGRFFQRIIELDDGWLAAFYDSMARVRGEGAQAYFLDPDRIERFYAAVRGKVTSPGPARPIFRASADLMLLAARADFLDSGAPRIPGGIEPWRDLFVKHPHGKYDGKLTASAAGWRDADDVIEAMFALSRKIIENEPLRMFLSISNVDRHRERPLSAAVVERLIHAYPKHGTQFSLYTDSPNLSDESILAHLDAMAALDRMRNYPRRANAMGMLQAQCLIWQALRRNGAIPEHRADESLQSLLALSAAVDGQQDVFELGRDGILAILRAADREGAESPQDTLLELLLGEPGEGEESVRQELLAHMNQLLALQRLVPLKTLFDLADHLERVSRGEAFNVAMANRLSASVSDIRLPRSLLSSEEANAMTTGRWVERHIQRQRSLNLRRAVDRAAGDPKRLLAIRGELVPILRDSLVGIVYALYAPPGAELIRANPLFVRSHDFLGPEARFGWSRTRMHATGWPSSGGGRLVGSLVGLPYELAAAEQNFLVPSQRQALIWQDLAPQMLIGATVPRWWDLRPADLHYVGLQVRMVRSALAQAALDPDLLAKLEPHLRRKLEPPRMWSLVDGFKRGRVVDAIRELTSSELIDLSYRLRELESEALSVAGGPFLPAIEELESRDSERFNERRLSQLFGMPHPRLADTYRLELLHLPLFPTLMGHSSRILAESWESNNLLWAELSDELHVPPAELNTLVPEWTKRTLERIFATHLDDWPALWRSLRIIADEVRAESGGSRPAGAEIAQSR